MDARRGGPRYVVDPKVRQVGFITAHSESSRETTTSSNLTPPLPISTVADISLSTVIIPPPRNMEPLPKSSPMPVPCPSPRKLPSLDDSMPPGSYNPPDFVLGTSHAHSPSNKHDRNGGYMSIPSENLSESSFSYMKRLNSGMEGLSMRGDDLPDRSVPKVAASHVSGAVESLATLSSFQQQKGVVPLSLPNASNFASAEHAESIAGGGKTGRERIEHGNFQKQGKAVKGGVSKKENVLDKKSPVVEKKGGKKGQEKEKRREVPAPRMQFDDKHRVAKAKRRSLVEQTEARNRVELFRHLPQFVYGTQLASLEAKFFQDDPVHPHPAVYQVGLQYLTGDIVGGNARCVAMLLAFREFIKDYNTPKEKTLVRDLTVKVNSQVSFLITCRPLSVSMGNAIRFLKTRIAKLTVGLSEAEAKAALVSEIDRFIQEKITFADKEITKHAVTKIRDGDVILTYAASCVVEMILLRAFELGKKFRVIIVDSRPKLEGKSLLRQLLGRGISCTYTHINAISYIMQEATRVVLGAASVLSNGTVYSRVGTACIAMVAHEFHIPVLICCETYKFQERVQLDSICSNELGDPEALVKAAGRKDLCELEGWAEIKNLQLLNLMYDATPADYVSMIITELGMVPPTSVPVILREYRREPLL